MPKKCPFCEVAFARIQMQNEAGIAILDAFPVTEGHTLVIPTKHVTSLFDLSPDEQAGIWRLVGEVRERSFQQLQPDGFNIGVNDGPAAGQTVMHAHTEH
jgi:diadenosine tetraphosphate (Ap4A) HIT family hydrolase